MTNGLRMHHVGLAVPDLAAAAKLYIVRLGYADRSGALHDPSQTAWVQFLRLAADAGYLELVAPDGPESRLTNFVRRGGGLHHVCYSCGAMEAEIARLAATGMLLLSEPRPAVAFAGRRICWLKGGDPLLVELVERRDDSDSCEPGV
jgi:methylmalonyl-CoA/ethylmalonyl-CoA epimerase